jgi:protein NrfD
MSLNIIFFYGLGEHALSKYWGLAIATYLFLGGLSGGMYITGYFAHLFRSRGTILDAISRFGTALSGIVLIIGLFSLIYDHPNVAITIINPTLFSNLGSWLAIGSWIILFFLIIWFVLLLEQLERLKIPDELRLSAMTINSFLAFMIILYTALLLRGATAVPMWQSLALPMLFVVSGISTGIAACALYGIIKKKKSELSLKAADAALIALEIGLVVYFLVDLSGMGSRSGFSIMSLGAKASLDLLVNGTYSTLFIYGFIGLGMVFPLVLYGLSLLKKSLITDAISSVSVLIGGYIFRIVVIAAAAKALVFP